MRRALAAWCGLQALACATPQAVDAPAPAPKTPAYPQPLPPDAPLPAGISIYGTYNDGCLLRSVSFDPADHPEFAPAFSIGYYRAHPDMQALLQRTGLEYAARFEDHRQHPLLLSDLSRDGGGQLLPHRSHQIGLDVDLFFFSSTGGPADLVETGQGVTPAFDMARNWWLAGRLAMTPGVDRIFVAAEVKGAFCAQTNPEHWGPQRSAVLRRLRPWFGHRDHFHVRMACPRGEPFCFSKVGDIPPGDGCHEVAAWLADPAHVQRRAQGRLAAPRAFNPRCHPETPNEIAHPIEGP